ncbi:MAG: DinB family protein [Anaerolineae bacterium]
MDNIIIEMVAVLSTTPGRWFALTETFSERSLRRRPAPQEWSALECLQHLIDLDRKVFPQRVRALLAGEDFPAFFPDEDGSALRDDISAVSLASEFESLRQENLTLLDQITPADLAKTATHAELGQVTLSNLLHEWGGHDLMHLVQAEQALMQPFIEGCGPWQVYFTQHTIIT